MLFVVEVVDIAAHLVMHLVDGPEYLGFALAFIGLILDVPHLLLEFEEGGLYLVPAGRHLLS